jgi:hypothetical protein
VPPSKVDGVLWRFKYSRAQFAEQLAAWSGGDAFYEAKARSIYEGKNQTNHKNHEGIDEGPSLKRP